jgi:hypothetical protein
MTEREANEWLKGVRSMTNLLSSEDNNLWLVRTAQYDGTGLLGITIY